MQAWAAQEPVATVSPLFPLLSAEGEHGSSELEALGFPVDGAKGSASGRLYDEALRIAAQPEALLELAELTPGEAPFKARFLLGQGKAVLCDLDSTGLSVSSPLLISDLIGALARHFENTPQRAPESVAIWRSQLTVIAALFSAGGEGFEATISRATAASRLAPLGVEPEDASAAIDELVGAQLLHFAEPSLSLTPGVAFWMRRVATVTVGELTLVSYPAEGEAQPAHTQVRFAGARGDRVTAVTFTGPDLEQLVKGPPPEEAAVSFSVLSQEALVRLLGTFLGVSSPTLPY